MGEHRTIAIFYHRMNYTLWMYQNLNMVIVQAMSGAAGIEPTLKALELGIDLALANKETLVSGGSLVRKAQTKSGAAILPVDSEHSAIYQCIEPILDGDAHIRWA